jgi:hypothetical protein
VIIRPNGEERQDFPMQPSPILASCSGAAARLLRGRRVEDLVYQAMTAAAMLATLVSIWLF